MTFMPAPKSSLSRVLLSVILCSLVAGQTLAAAAEPRSVYRFGEWTLLTPLMPANGGMPPGQEWLLYWQDGSQRALSLRFDADPKREHTLLRSGAAVSRLKGCSPRGGGNIPPLHKARAQAASEDQEWADGRTLLLSGGTRGLGRSGDTLVADLADHRVQITADSPLVRVGEWDSADFCRYELRNSPGDDED